MYTGGSCAATLSVLLIRERRLSTTGLHEKEAYNASEECSKEISIQDILMFSSNVSRTALSRLR